MKILPPQRGKKPLIFFIILLTVFLADSIGWTIADLILFHTLAAVDLIELNAEEAELFSPFQIEDVIDCTLRIGDNTAFFTAVHVRVATDFILFQILDAFSRILVKINTAIV